MITTAEQAALDAAYEAQAIIEIALCEDDYNYGGVEYTLSIEEEDAAYDAA